MSDTIDDVVDDAPPGPPPGSPDGLDDFVSRNPVTALFGAVLVGFLIGRLGLL